MKYFLFLFFSFKGRISRKEFWFIYPIVTFYLYSYPALLHNLEKTPYVFINILQLFVITIIPLWINYSVQVKRWHDINVTGWVSIINLVPFLGTLVTILTIGLIKGDKNINKFG